MSNLFLSRKDKHGHADKEKKKRRKKVMEMLKKREAVVELQTFLDEFPGFVSAALDDDGNTLLHCAVLVFLPRPLSDSRPLHAICSFLLSRGADPLARNAAGATAAALYAGGGGRDDRLLSLLHTLPIPAPAICNCETDFERLASLGAGASGTVFRARFTRTGETVALKTLPDLREDVGGYRWREFEREVEALSRTFLCPYMARMVCFCQSKRHPSLALELFDGALSDYLCANAPARGLSRVQQVQVLLRVAQALNFLHTLQPAPVLHRDVKPENILISFAGRSDAPRAVLSDFGIARAVRSLEEDALLTRGAGTPAYLAPEALISGDVDIGPAADVFAFGVVIDDLLCGRANKTSVILRYEAGERPRPISGATRALLYPLALLCWAQDPNERPTAYELVRGLRALLNYLQGMQTSPERDDVMHRAARATEAHGHAVPVNLQNYLAGLPFDPEVEPEDAAASGFAMGAGLNGMGAEGSPPTCPPRRDRPLGRAAAVARAPEARPPVLEISDDAAASLAKFAARAAAFQHFGMEFMPTDSAGGARRANMNYHGLPPILRATVTGRPQLLDEYHALFFRACLRQLGLERHEPDEQLRAWDLVLGFLLGLQARRDPHELECHRVLGSEPVFFGVSRKEAEAMLDLGEGAMGQQNPFLFRVSRSSTPGDPMPRLVMSYILYEKGKHYHSLMRREGDHWVLELGGGAEGGKRVMFAHVSELSALVAGGRDVFPGGSQRLELPALFVRLPVFHLGQHNSEDQALQDAKALLEPPMPGKFVLWISPRVFLVNMVTVLADGSTGRRNFLEVEIAKTPLSKFASILEASWPTSGSPMPIIHLSFLAHSISSKIHLLKFK